MQWDVQSDDTELMKRISNGDKNAFNVLMQRHLTGIVNFNKQYLPQDAEDITQEAFIRLWNKAPEWQDKGFSPKAWLLRVSYNLCIDVLRKHKTVSLDDKENKIADPEYREEHLHIAQIDFQQQLQALKNLPQRQCSAIILCAYNGLNNKEAAKVLNISVDALESLLARGRRTLRRKLIEQELAV